MKNFTFYNREAESFWLILGYRGVLGFLLVFQIIPSKYIIRSSQEPSLKSTEKDALNGPSRSDHLAPHCAVLGLAIAPGSVLGRQCFKSSSRPTESELTSSDSQDPQIWEALVCTHSWGSQAPRGYRVFHHLMWAWSVGWKRGSHLCLETPMFQCIRGPLGGEPALGNSEACPWLSWGGPRRETSWFCRIHVRKCWRHSISKRDLCF